MRNRIRILSRKAFQNETARFGLFRPKTERKRLSRARRGLGRPSAKRPARAVSGPGNGYPGLDAVSDARVLEAWHPSHAVLGS